jgi:multidrug efflux pump subunit AcrB
MWIVALALRRPYTFIVMALVIIILTPITILRTATDIFPDIDSLVLYWHVAARHGRPHRR